MSWRAIPMRIPIILPMFDDECFDVSESFLQLVIYRNRRIVALQYSNFPQKLATTLPTH